VLLVGQPVDPRRLEEDAGLLAEHLLVGGELRKLDGDRSDLAAGDGEIRWVFVETKWLTPSTFSSL